MLEGVGEPSWSRLSASLASPLRSDARLVQQSDHRINLMVLELLSEPSADTKRRRTTAAKESFG